MRTVSRLVPPAWRAALSAASLPVSLLVVLALLSPAVLAQSDEAPVQLSGTLQKIRAAGAITLAYRESSIPFSYLSPRGER